LAVESGIGAESFYIPAHQTIYGTVLDIAKQAGAVDLLTVSERLRAANELERLGGQVFLERLVDSTPTAAHAEFYIDIVRQKHLLRCIIACAQEAEGRCYESDESADLILGRTEQSFLDITERQHEAMASWPDMVKRTMAHVETILSSHRGLTGLSTGFRNLDRVLLGLRGGEMLVLAARPSMGKTSLAMNIAENVALGHGDPESKPHAVGVFSLEMSAESLVMRMLCCMAEVSGFKLSGGYVKEKPTHGKLTNAASRLMKAPIYVDDTGGLDVAELRTRARRMKKKHGIELIVIDYLQMLHARDSAREGRQQETAAISGNLKAMAKELRVPVLVLSQLSRAPEQREKTGKPKLSDLRDSGAIEQDADVVCLLRRPCRYDADPEYEDKALAIIDVAKQRNGPTGEVRLNFEEDYTRFRDRMEQGVDAPGAEFASGAEETDG
jgi:replicative DNA helicase